MESYNTIRRGDVFFAELTGGVGSEQNGVRPVLVLQNDVGNRHSPTIIVAPLTSKGNKSMLPTHVKIHGATRLLRNSTVLLEQIRTIDRRRLRGYVCSANHDTMMQVDSVYAPTLDKLREYEEQVIVDRHDGIKTDVKALSVNDVFDLWCNLKRGVKDSTMKNYIYMYEMFVRPTFGKKRLVTVKKSDVRGFYNRLADEKILKISTIDGIHNVLHQVFQVAVDDEYIRNNPTDNMLKELKQAHCMDSEKRKALTMEEEKIFLEYLMQKPKYRHWYPVFYIMANTGMRVGEITGLRWRDIDFDEGLISVNHTFVYYNHRDEHGCYYSINTPKTKAGERTIPMTDQVKNAFQMEREYQEEVGISSIDRIDGYDDFVFVNRFGMVQSQSTLNKAIKRIMRDCNGKILDNAVPGKEPTLLPDFSCHSLRHTFATRLCESGTNIKVIQDVLGHADVSTTMNIYVDVTNELKKNELKSFSAYMEGA